jgi:hypothetical protein
VPVGETQLTAPKSDFHVVFPAPSSLVGKSSVEIELRVEPTHRVDGQEYGAVFGKIAILP